MVCVFQVKATCKTRYRFAALISAWKSLVASPASSAFSVIDPETTAAVNVQVSELERQGIEHAMVDHHELVVMARHFVRGSRDLDSSGEEFHLQLAAAFLAAAIGTGKGRVK